MTARRIIIGISGASGFQYGVKALELLQGQGLEVHVVISKGAERTCELETGYQMDEVITLANVIHSIDNLGAAISSGSFRTLGMLVAPCSMRTLASIAHCFSDNLLTRAADVVLKERRLLVLLVRETPLNLGHLRNMQSVTEMGGIIFPPIPALYQHPQTADEIVTHSVARSFDLFGIKVKHLPRWGEGVSYKTK